MTDKELKFKGKHLSIHVWRQQLIGGGFEEFEKVTRRPTVSIIAESNGKIILIREHRYENNAVVLKFPAGFVNDDELPETAAQRELQEETGFKAGKLTLIARTEPRSTFDFPEYVYLAQNLSKNKLPHDAGEVILEVLESDIGEIAQKIINKELYYSFTSFVFLQHFWESL